MRGRSKPALHQAGDELQQSGLHPRGRLIFSSVTTGLDPVVDAEPPHGLLDQVRQ
jgi:hypothetical protein